MIRGLLFAFTVWVAVVFGISLFMHLSCKERLTTIKLLAYSGLCAVLALSIVSGIVILF
jgi:hypothetical protein